MSFIEANKEALLAHVKANRDTQRWLAEGENGELTCITIRGPATCHAFRILRNWEDAEDAAQDAYVKLLETQEVTPWHEYIDALFYSMLTNISLNILRKRRGGPDTEALEDSEEAMEQPDETGDPLRCLLSSESLEEIQSLLGEVGNTKRKAAIEQCLVYQMPFREVAETLGTHPTTVSKWVRDFRNELRGLEM